MDECRITRAFLTELLDDEIELWNLANNHCDSKLKDLYQKNIDKIKELLNA